MSSKKKDTFWSVGSPNEELENIPFPKGTESEVLDLGEDTLLHVVFPNTWVVEQVEGLKVWAEAIKKSFSRKKIKVICSTEDIKFRVFRPRHVRIEIKDSQIQEPDLLLKLQEVFKDGNVAKLDVVIDKTTIKKGTK